MKYAVALLVFGAILFSPRAFSQPNPFYKLSAQIEELIDENQRLRLKLSVCEVATSFLPDLGDSKSKSDDQQPPQEPVEEPIISDRHQEETSLSRKLGDHVQTVDDDEDLLTRLDEREAERSSAQDDGVDE